MATLTVTPTTSFKGMTNVPGDKSISHRALLLGSLTDGTNHIRGWLDGGDTLATLEAMRALGLNIERDGTTLKFDGAPLTQPNDPIDCVNAGTLIRILAGLLTWQSFETILDGSEQLRKRPMRRVTEPLRAIGAKLKDTDGKAPMTISPTEVMGGEQTLKVASAQVKSCLLLAGLGATHGVTVHSPGPSRDHTERMLEAMGADIESDGYTVVVQPLNGRRLAPLDMTVPGDISSAAFPIVAACIMQDASVTLNDIGLNKTRTGLLDILLAMQANLNIEQTSIEGGEPIGKITARNSPELHGTEIAGDVVVRAIDELPIITVAATQASGTTVISDAQELRVKEVDRISLVAQELTKMGAKIEEKPDGMTIEGPVKLKGASVHSHGDHRLGMALAVAGLVAEGETVIEEAECIADSFPGFEELMSSLGAQFS